MYIQDYKHIESELLKYQNYFLNSYVDAELLEVSEPSGLFIRVGHTKQMIPIAFNQHEGNLFYIRRLSPIEFIRDDMYKVRSRLVALTRGIDSVKQIECFANFFVNILKDKVSLTQIDNSIERVLKSEGMSNNVIGALLSRFTDENIISVDFTTYISYVANNCDCKPCLNC